MEKNPCYVMKIKEFPTCVLEPCNRVIGDILGRAFEPLAQPSSNITLFWLLELQRIEITLQDKLNQDPDAVHTATSDENQDGRLSKLCEGKEISFNFYQFMGENIL